MNIAESNKNAIVLYDTLRTISLTGKYGKANLVVDTDSEYLKRVRILCEMAAISRSYASYAAGMVSYSARRLGDDLAKESAKSSAFDIKRKFTQLSIQVFKTAVSSNSSFINKAPWNLTEERITSSSGATTCVYRIIELQHQLHTGKKDLLNDIANRLVEAIIGNYKAIIRGYKDIKVVEIETDFKGWVKEIHVNSSYNFVALRNEVYVFDEYKLSFMRDHSKRLETLPESVSYNDPLFVTYMDTLHVIDNAAYKPLI